MYPIFNIVDLYDFNYQDKEDEVGTMEKCKE
jgi:hypothetical protein